MTTEATTTQEGSNVSTKIIELPSGRKAETRKYKGRDIREAQRIADGDPGKITFALIAMSTTIDGQPIAMEDLDEMDGPDVLKLMGEFGSNF